MIIKLKSFSALIAKLIQPLNFLTLSNDQNPAKPRHRPFEQSLFLFSSAPPPCAHHPVPPDDSVPRKAQPNIGRRLRAKKSELWREYSSRSGDSLPRTSIGSSHAQSNPDKPLENGPREGEKTKGGERPDATSFGLSAVACIQQRRTLLRGPNSKNVFS